MFRVISDGEVVCERDGCIEVTIRHTGSSLEVSVSEKDIGCLTTDFNDIYCCEDTDCD